MSRHFPRLLICSSVPWQPRPALLGAVYNRRNCSGSATVAIRSTFLEKDISPVFRSTVHSVQLLFRIFQHLRDRWLSFLLARRAQSRGTSVLLCTLAMAESWVSFHPFHPFHASHLIPLLGLGWVPALRCCLAICTFAAQWHRHDLRHPIQVLLAKCAVADEVADSRQLDAG